MIKFKKWLRENILYLAWIQALAATVISLYISEILKFTPCVLCWYQRILMYPLVIIILVGIINKDKKAHRYILPFSIAGTLLALYQWLLQMGVIPDSIAPCALGISCTTKYISFFNFITIPFLSFLAFAFITACAVIFMKLINNKK